MAEDPMSASLSAVAPASSEAGVKGTGGAGGGGGGGEDSELTKLLKEYPNLKTTANGERIKCCFTGHEMLVDLKAVNQYIRGKKYKNYLKNPTFDFATYQPHLQPVVTTGSGKKRGGGGGGGGGSGGGRNTDNHKQLYCQLTQRLINKDPVHVLKHVQGTSPDPHRGSSFWCF